MDALNQRIVISDLEFEGALDDYPAAWQKEEPVDLAVAMGGIVDIAALRGGFAVDFGGIFKDQPDAFGSRLALLKNMLHAWGP